MPAGASSKPALKSWIAANAYISSSADHLPRRCCGDGVGICEEDELLSLSGLDFIIIGIENLFRAHCYHVYDTIVVSVMHVSLPIALSMSS